MNKLGRAVRAEEDLAVHDLDLFTPGKRLAVPLIVTAIVSTSAVGALRLVTQLYLKGLGAGVLTIGLTSSLGSVGAVLGSIFWGQLSDRRGKKWLLIISVFMISAAVALLALLPPASIVIGSTFVQIFMFTGVLAMSAAIVSRVSTKARRGRNLSYISSARSFGFAIGSAGVGFLLELLGFRGVFIVLALLPLLGVASLAIFPSEPRPSQAKKESSWRIAAQAGLTNLYLGTILRQMGVSGFLSLLFVYMVTLHISPGAMGVTSALNTGAQVLGMLIFGRLVDRIGRRRIFILGFALSAAVPCVFPFAANIWGMALGYLALGVAYSSLFIGSTAHIGDRVSPGRQGAMLGLYESSRGLGGIIGPIIAGAITPIVGFGGMFFTMAGIGLLGFVMAIIPERARLP